MCKSSSRGRKIGKQYVFQRAKRYMIMLSVYTLTVILLKKVAIQKLLINGFRPLPDLKALNDNSEVLLQPKIFDDEL